MSENIDKATIQLTGDKWTVKGGEGASAWEFVGTAEMLAAHFAFTMVELAALRSERDRLREACVAFVAWLEWEESSPNYGTFTRDEHPEGERIWRQWWDCGQRLCREALDKGRSALAQPALAAKPEDESIIGQFGDIASKLPLTTESPKRYTNAATYRAEQAAKPVAEPRLKVVVDEKYTVVEEADGRLHALRYGEPWRDCVGDGLILSLAYELESSRDCMAEVRDAIADALGGWRYIRTMHGDLSGVGWDRVEQKLSTLLSKIGGEHV